MSSLLTNDNKAFENASTNVAAAQMRNSLTELAETVKDPDEKRVSYRMYEYALQHTNKSLIAIRNRNGQLLRSIPPILE